MDSGDAVGWAESFLKSYREEKVADNFSPLGANKLQFHDYGMAVPVIAQDVDFSVQVQAAMKLAKDTGDDGHCLLSSASTDTCPSAHSISRTRRTMYVSYDACASGSAAAMRQLSGKIITTPNCSSNLLLFTCIIVYGHWQCILY